MTLVLSTVAGYDAAYVHVVVNHFPVFSMVSAVVPLLVGLVVKSRAAVIAGLLLMVLAAGGTGLTMASGEAAYEAVEAGTGALVLDEVSHELMEIHEHRAHDWAKAAYIVGGLAAAGLLLVALTDRATRSVAAVGVLLCVGCAGLLGWIAQSGGVIVHEEFREVAAVNEPTDADSADAIRTGEAVEPANDQANEEAGEAGDDGQ